METEVDAAYIQEAVKHSPEYLLDIMSQIVEVLLAKLNVPQEERDTFAGQIKERKMAELFANFKAYDVQEARAKAMAEGHAEGHAQGLIAGQMQERENGIKKLIKVLKKCSLSKGEIAVDLAEQYDLSESEAMEKVRLYWD